MLIYIYKQTTTENKMTKQEIYKTVEYIYELVNPVYADRIKKGTLGNYYNKGRFPSMNFVNGGKFESEVRLIIFEKDFDQYDSLFEEVGIEYKIGFSYLKGMQVLYFDKQ